MTFDFAKRKLLNARSYKSIFPDLTRIDESYIEYLAVIDPIQYRKPATVSLARDLWMRLDSFKREAQAALVK